MEKLLRRIHAALSAGRETVAVAESLTGGMIASALTRLPGSSAFFTLGVVTYSNASKEKLLRIPALLISKRGAVSREIACRMAEGVRRLGCADHGLGITGIAGPTGGSGPKPVGTVFIALASKGPTACRKFAFRGSRAAIRRKARDAALAMLINRL